MEACFILHKGKYFQSYVWTACWCSSTWWWQELGSDIFEQTLCDGSFCSRKDRSCWAMTYHLYQVGASDENGAFGSCRKIQRETIREQRYPECKEGRMISRHMIAMVYMLIWLQRKTQLSFKNIHLNSCRIRRIHLAVYFCWRVEGGFLVCWLASLTWPPLNLWQPVQFVLSLGVKNAFSGYMK